MEDKGYEGVSRDLFSFRERKSLAVSFLKFRQILNFPPELFGGTRSA